MACTFSCDRHSPADRMPVDLTSITFTAEGNPSTRPSPMDPNIKLINFDRQVKLAKIVTDFARYQQPFNLAILQDVQNWLTGVLAEKGSASIDALYRKSREWMETHRMQYEPPVADTIGLLSHART